MPEITINYLAVLLTAIVRMIVGILWYGPIFGKQWKKLMGFTDESMKVMKMKPMQATAGGFVTALIMAYVLAYDSFVWSGFFGSSVGPIIVRASACLLDMAWICRNNPGWRGFVGG